ncbi:MAG: hypothetical protein LLG05_15190 [Porphyromonadaceae bacterium]|nr:hypothetical protein [Porphyromonadaceae bacterium]
MNIYKMPRLLIWLTMGRIIAITLLPLGIFTRDDSVSTKTLNHEMIHAAQQREMLYLVFYLWYLLEWLIRLLINGRQAYMKISFEQEAYSNDKDAKYLVHRKKFAWIKFLSC